MVGSTYHRLSSGGDFEMDKIALLILIIVFIIFSIVAFSLFFYFKKKRKLYTEDIQLKKEVNLFIKYNLKTKEVGVSNIDNLDLDFGKIIENLKKNEEFQGKVNDFINNSQNDDYTLSFVNKKQVKTLVFKFKSYNKEDKTVIIKCTYRRDFKEDKTYKLLDVKTFKEKYAKDNTKGTLYYINVTDFNLINQRYGETTGDYVLYILKKRLKQLENYYRVPAYMGKDHFLLYVTKRIDDKRIQKLARLIIKELVKPIDINGLFIELGINIGVSKNVEGDIGEFINHAYIASEHCKEAKEEIIVYNDKLRSAEMAAFHSKKELDQILDKSRINLKYLPIYSFDNNKVIGYISEMDLNNSNVNFDKIRNYAVQNNSYEKFIDIYFKSHIFSFMKKRPYKRSKLLLNLKLEDVIEFHEFIMSDNTFVGTKIIINLDVRKGFDVINRKPQVMETLNKINNQRIEIALLINENLFYEYDSLLKITNYIILNKNLVRNIHEDNLGKNKLDELIKKAKQYNLAFIATDINEYLELETLLKREIKLMSGTYFSPWEKTPSEIEYSKTKKLTHLLKNNYY